MQNIFKLSAPKAAAGILFGLLLAQAHAASAALLFQDDFSSGDLSKYNAYFRWGRDGSIPTAGSGASSISAVTGPSGASVKAIRLNYGTWQEQRFHLTSSANEVRTETGSSNTVYQEVWFQYDLLVPANYTHGTITGAANNKGWVTLWKGHYGVAETYKSAFDFIDFQSGSNTPSGASAQGVWAWGQGGYDRRLGWGTVLDAAGFNQRSDGQKQPYAFRPADYGKWVKMTVGMKASDIGKNNGYMKIYRNGEPVVEWTGLDNYQSKAGPYNGVDRGYLFGYWNTVHSTPVTFYLTNFKFGTSAADLIGSATASPTSPATIASPTAPGGLTVKSGAQ